MPMPARPQAANRVLVLDGETRAALAVVRSLGRQDIDVGVAAHAPGGLAQRSRFASTLFECPDPQEAPEMYLKWLVQVVEQWKPRMILPITDASLTLCLKVEEMLPPDTVLPTVGRSTFEQVSDKANLIKVAESIGVPVPKTYLIPGGNRKSESHEQIIRGFHYPAVLKPKTTVSDLRSHFVKGGVHYPEDADEVFSLVYGEDGSSLHQIDFLLQERIEGEGVGVFALCNEGEALALFAHKRILEKPPSGGRSVLSESIPLEEAPVEEALALLRHFKVQGVAMVEFKKTASGQFYLMEINPRFWGSLQLAIDCGRDFPSMLYRLYLIGYPFPPAAVQHFSANVQDYELHKRLRWCLGTVDHAFIKCKQDFSGAFRRIVRENSLELWKERKRTRLEVCRREDFFPFLYELRRYLIDLFSNPRGEH